MEKESKRLVISATPLVCLMVLIYLLYSDVLGLNATPLGQRNITVSQWMLNLNTKAVHQGVVEHDQLKFGLRRLVRGEDLAKLDATGFACDSTLYSLVCVAIQSVSIDTNATTIHILSNPNTTQSQTLVRPYARQYDSAPLNYTTPVQILYQNTTPPLCQYNHDVPVVIFSSSGFIENLFHEFNEIIIPLFITTHHFQSHVQFILLDYKPKFVRRYNRILSHLSKYEVINPATNGSVHCFEGAVVGLKFHNQLALNSSDIPGNYSMLDFKQFLRESFNIKAKNITMVRRPILVLVSRQKSRTFLKEDELVSMMDELGFEVVVARPQMMSNLAEFAKILSSCSVLVGAHGAGLTNEMFLPEGAVVVQVVPLGLEWPSSNYFGEPAGEMGLHYLEYRIEPEESSLIDLYSRDDPVIVDPGSVFAKGYQFGRVIYIDGQHVKINLVRFKKTLIEALRLIGRPTSLS